MCVFCKTGEIKKSTTTHVVNYKDCLIIIKNVPCDESTRKLELKYLIYLRKFEECEEKLKYLRAKFQCKEYCDFIEASMNYYNSKYDIGLTQIELADRTQIKIYEVQNKLICLIQSGGNFKYLLPKITSNPFSKSNFILLNSIVIPIKKSTTPTINITYPANASIRFPFRCFVSKRSFLPNTYIPKKIWRLFCPK